MQRLPEQYTNKVKLSHRAASVYDEYQRTIASSCDDVMLQRNSSWRHDLYKEDLEKVLDISSYSENLPVNPRPSLNTALAITNQQWSQHESPSSARSSHSSNSGNSVSAVLTPSTYHGSSGSPSKDESFILTPEMSPSSSPVELPAPDSSSSRTPETTKSTSLRCPMCNTPFNGKPRDQKSNRRRHISLMHEPISQYTCPDCDKSCKRSDYLLNHRRAVHGFDSCAAAASSAQDGKAPTRSEGS